jgi:hypothetical protein
MTSRIDFSNPMPGSKTAVRMTSAVYRFKEKSIGLSYRLFYTFTQNGPTEIFLRKKFKQARQGQGRRLAPLFWLISLAPQ